MKKFIPFIFSVLPLVSFSQANLEGFEIPNPENKNIVVKKLYSDTLSSSFLIQILDSVQLHKHAHHTEQVYVLGGRGKMKVGRRSFDIYPGSIIIIPMGTAHSVKVTESPLKVISFQSPEFFGEDRIILK